MWNAGKLPVRSSRQAAQQSRRGPHPAPSDRSAAPPRMQAASAAAAADQLLAVATVDGAMHATAEVKAVSHVKRPKCGLKKLWNVGGVGGVTPLRS